MGYLLAVQLSSVGVGGLQGLADHWVEWLQEHVHVVVRGYQSSHTQLHLLQRVEGATGESHIQRK